MSGYNLPDSPGGRTGPKPRTDKSFLNSVSNTIASLKNKFTGRHDLGGSTDMWPSGHVLNVSGEAWPQTQTVSDFNNSDLLKQLYPGWKSKGFLPPVLCAPRTIAIRTEENEEKTMVVLKKRGDYVYQDWRGQMIEKKPGYPNSAQNFKSKETSDRFNLSLSDDLPRKSNQDLIDNPYSTRDLLSIFGDYSTDYFKHGLQIVDNIGTIPPSMSDFYKSGQSADYRKTNFIHTPFENTDPVIFGFEIIFDDISSPLLNGSVGDFLNLMSNVSEINARKRVYEEFKYQFTKFFKTKASVRFDEEQLSITRVRNFGNPESEKNQKISESGKKSYKSYYVQKIGGLGKLIESNTPSDKKYIADYNKDVITLDFHESVSLSVGTLAHLYKLLYWSKPNGKGIVPENLLRFNCDIIISELRNFARVRKSGNNLEVIKDNLSRYIYSLRECQFYFDKMPHEDALDLTQPKHFEHVQIQFDYKYSTMKFERFVPEGDTGHGKYVGYNSGAIWKVGNPGERDNRKQQNGGALNDSSIPKFYTVNNNTYNQNGVSKPIVLSVPSGRVSGDVLEPTPTDDKIEEQEDSKETAEQQNSSSFEQFKKNDKNLAAQGAERALNAGKASLQSENRRIRARTARSVRGLLSKITGMNGISPPRNVYKGPILGSPVASRVFYDVRGELLNFAGDAMGNLINEQK